MINLQNLLWKTVVLFITLIKVVLTFESVDEILKYDHSNESYWAVLSCGTVYYTVQGGSNFWVCGWNPTVQHFSEAKFTLYMVHGSSSILWTNSSDKSIQIKACLRVLLHGNVCFAMCYKINFGSCSRSCHFCGQTQKSKRIFWA